MSGPRGMDWAAWAPVFAAPPERGARAGIGAALRRAAAGLLAAVLFPSVVPLVLHARSAPEPLELWRQHHAWEAVRPEDYTFRYRRESFRNPGTPVRVVVRGGRAAGQPCPDYPRTIDDLFAQAACAHAHGQHVGLWYDPVLRYPVLMVIDNPRAFDDERAIHIDSFAVLRPR